MNNAHNRRALGLWRNPHIWYITLLILATSVLAFHDFIVDAIGLPHTEWGVILEAHSLHWILFLLPILYAAYVFGVRGAVIITPIVTVLFISHTVLLLPAELEHLFADTAFFVLMTIVGILIAVLRNQREQIQKAYTAAVESGEALRNSKELIETVFESVHDSISVIDTTSFAIVRVNRGFLDSLNLEEKDVTGKHCYEVTHRRTKPCESPNETCPLGETLKTGCHSSVEHIHYDKYGKEIYVEVSTSPIRNEKGEIHQVVHIARDITERKRVEEALRESEERYRLLFERSSDAIFLVDSHTGQYLGANAAAERLTGRSVSEIKTLTTSEVTPAGAAERLQQVTKMGDASDFGEVTYVRPDGTTRTALLTGVRLSEQVVFGIAHDITERKQAEEALEAGRKKLEDIMENVIDGIGVSDAQGKVIQANKALAEMHGYDSPDEVIGRTFFDFVAEEELPRVVERFQQMMAKKEKTVRNLEMTNLKKDGSKFSVMTNLTNSWDEDGSLIASFVVIHDITERKQAEEALKSSEEKYRSLFDNMLNGFAYCKILVDENNRPIDFVYLEVNDAFERLTGIKKETVLGKRVTEAIPGIKESKTDLFSIYGKVALTGEETKFDVYFEPIEKWLTISVYSPQKGYFVAVFDDITERKRAEEALQESEENLRTYLERAPDGVYLNDLKGTFLYGNKKAEEIMGYKREELVGKSFLKLNLLPAKYLAKAGKLLALNAMGRPTGPDELELRRKDGSRVWVEINTTPIKQGGKVVVIGFVRDITERQQADAKLRESDERYRAIFESTSDMLVLIDRKGKILDVNQNIEEVGGHGREEILGKNIRSLAKMMTKKSLAIVAKNFLKRMAGMNIPPYEIQMIRKNGELTSVEINAVALRKDGRIVGDLAILKDITERKRIEEALRESEEKYRRLVEHIKDAVYTLDREGRFTYFGPRFEDITGYRPQDLIGHSFTEILAPEYIESTVDHFRQGLSGETTPLYEIELLRRDGSRLPIELNVTSILDAKGQPIGRLGVVRDITERKRAEEREKRLQQELTLASRLASIGQMASGVAHEINNPLTGVIGFSQLLMRRDIPDDIKDDLQVINSEAQRVARIVEGLLTFARQHKPGREYVDINHIISSVLELRSYEMKVNNIEVMTQFAPDLPQTIADGSQLQQVFLNIILNAEKEMIREHNRGRLSVKTEKIGNSIRVSFTDDGPGISKENLDKIFDPFFTTREVGDGTGLGLSICHGIVTQHNGRIYAKSKLGKGATLVVELPIVAETGKTEKARVIDEEPSKKNGAKVLVVDDEKTILAFLKHLLTEQGCEVATAGEAHAAVERLRSEKYDLILLDIKMPVMDGIELYHHIEATDPALAQRVIFITGDLMETTTRDFLNKTKAPHIAKPFDIEQLKKDINHILTKDVAVQ